MMRTVVKVEDVQALGLKPYEARALVALLEAGTATSAALHKTSGVPRTSVYKVMERLIELRLAHQVAGFGAAVWATNGWASVLGQLDANAVADLDTYRDRIRLVQDQLGMAS